MCFCYIGSIKLLFHHIPPCLHCVVAGTRIEVDRIRMPTTIKDHVR